MSRDCIDNPAEDAAFTLRSMSETRPLTPRTAAGKALLGVVLGMDPQGLYPPDPAESIALVEREAVRAPREGGLDAARLVKARADAGLLTSLDNFDTLPDPVTSPDPRPLTFAEFAKTNRERCEAPDGFGHPITGWSISDWMLAATGEFGEAANVAKKLNRIRDGIPGNTQTEAELRQALADEFADAVIYLDLAAQSQGIDLGTAVASKFNKTSEKIGAPHRLATLDAERAPRDPHPCSCGHTDGQHYEGCLECDRQYREHGMADRD